MGQSFLNLRNYIVPKVVNDANLGENVEGACYHEFGVDDVFRLYVEDRYFGHGELAFNAETMADLVLEFSLSLFLEKLPVPTLTREAHVAIWLNLQKEHSSEDLALALQNVFDTGSTKGHVLAFQQHRQSLIDGNTP